ncbi:MAG: KpsF/GutQ family sugar-phosphate isomerase [Chlamydiae bacterium]|nr:MAG: KpsF/GutQ family sugar-phosphate isomerase [Chlamydiota bacterium]
MTANQKIAKNVLLLEAESVKKLIDLIDNQFDVAVDLIMDCRGRVITTGMGKCGIIGKKLSATLASTGTPATNVHPAEAIHGDFGMITSADVIIAISNSGETEEIIRLLPTIKKIGAKLIAMSGNPSSILAKQSDVVILTSVEREACPFNLAPTASTTAQLAMGDALAMALLAKRDFKPEDYAQLHPGGSLGRKLLKVKDVMRKGDRLVKVSPETKVRDVIVAMTETRNGAACIVDENDYVTGFFSDGDFRRNILKNSAVIDEPVSNVMSSNPTTISADRLAIEAAQIMRSGNTKFSQLPVLDDENHLIGLLDDDELLSL